MTATTVPGTTTSRRPWLASAALVAGVGGGIALAITNAVVALTPGYSDIEDTADLVRVVAEQRTLIEIGTLVSLLSAALLVPGIWAVAARLAPRTPRLAAVGGAMMATGYVFFMVLPVETFTALAVAASGEDPTTYAAAVDGHTSWVAIVAYATFGLGALGGGLVLGVSMLRQRGAVPAWAGWALVASEPVRVVGLVAGIAVGPPIASLLIAVAFGGTLLATRRG